MEAAFLADIAAHADDDAPRLIFADWLHDHGQEERAEFIRLQCQLDPDRDRFDDPVINAVRTRVEALTQPYEQAESDWLIRLGAMPQHEYLGRCVVWRRGFVDELLLPAQWVVRYGAELRRRYPLLRKLTVFRVNGWGQRLAECPCLEGIREVEFPCWYDNVDAEAVAGSLHLGAVERVVCWYGDRSHEQGAIFAQGAAWPGLRNLHLVAGWSLVAWLAVIDRVAGRAVATAYDLNAELFPFSPERFFVGKLPDGTQWYIEIQEPTQADIQAFDADGTPRGEIVEYQFPPDLIDAIDVDWSTVAGREAYWAWEKRRDAARREHLRQRFGFVPAFIRVKHFHFGVASTIRLDMTAEDQWGGLDDPDVEYEPHSPYLERGFLGVGGYIHAWVTNGSFLWGDSGCTQMDRRG